EPRRLDMHPVEVPDAAERNESFGLPERPPFLIFGPRKLRTGARPFELIARGIEVEGRAPCMCRPGRTAAHAPHIQAAAESVEPEFADARRSVMIEHAHQHAPGARADLLVAGEAGNLFGRLPGNAHRIAFRNCSSGRRSNTR